jgi:hypothetical protein
VVLAQALQVDELGVPAVAVHQLGVGALLDDAALVEHVDNVGLLDRRQTMGNGNGRTALGGLVQSSLHHLFTLTVEGGCGLVK